MRKVWLVVKREYLTRVRTKGFIFGTFAVPLIMLAMIIVPALLATRPSSQSKNLAVIDATGNLSAALAQGLDQKLPNGQPAYRIVQEAANPPAPEAARLADEFRARVNRGELDGFLIIPAGILQKEAAVLHTRNPGDFGVSAAIQRALDDAATAQRLKARGVEVKDVRGLVGGVKLTLVKVTEKGEVVEKGQTIILAIALMFFLYMTIFVYGLATMQSVQEEKNTRVVEILVSSLRPTHLLWGKLLGVGAVGFTQLAVWLTAAGILGAYSAAVAGLFRPGASFPRFPIPLHIVAFIAVFFVSGYFLYASLYAAIGAMVSSTEESQQVSAPINILLGFSPALLGVIIRNPSSPIAVALSMIPFFSPVHMVLRITLQMPPLWQVLLSIFIIVLTTSALVYLSARIYRVGILMYGKRPSLVELARWVRYM
ncbi:MAG: ABC transporter permease [Terriglobia bacterium]